ncbi:hypothetical protein ACJJIW_01590 [Microbulbifer sp. JMSA004]|uniref:hypothetical protein n=1 Tax=Microbulbifer sp. JMSA004 TaxID=3243370 RepID=UPI00403A0CE5
MNKVLLLPILLALGVETNANEDMRCSNVESEQKMEALVHLKAQVITYKEKHGFFPDSIESGSPIFSKNLSPVLRDTNIWIADKDKMLQAEAELVSSCYLEKKDCQTYKSHFCYLSLESKNGSCQVKVHQLFALNCGK